MSGGDSLKVQPNGISSFWILLALTVLAPAEPGKAQGPSPNASTVRSHAASYPYSPDNYLHAPSDHSMLAVFPLAGKAINILLPFALGNVAFGPDGKTLYATVGFDGFDPGKQNETRRGLLKIEFNPTRVSDVPGTVEFGSFFSVAVAVREDKILISGERSEGDSRSCGVFELTAGFCSSVR